MDLTMHLFLFCESMLFAQCAQFMTNAFLLTDINAFWFNGFCQRKHMVIYRMWEYGNMSY